jgi:transposase
VTQSAEERIAELEAKLAERDELIAELKAKLEAALARIADLEAKLNQNSSNSSKPPSSDPPWWKNRPKTKRKNKGKRKRGAQKGHKGSRRELLPPEKIRHTTDVHPDQCQHCGSSNLFDDGSEPIHHQVTDIPRIEPFTDEWRQHLGVCRDCGETTRAALPEGVPRSNFGPGLTALVALLTGIYKVGKRGVRQLLRDVFNVVMSLGAVSNCEEQVSEALAQPFEGAREHAQRQAVAHADETSWRECAQKVWLWVMATTWVSVFHILPGRTKKCARYVVGSFKGILVSDRYKGYLFYAMSRRQLCWAHLIREFVGFSEHGGVTSEIGKDLLKLTKKMFEWWDQLGDGKISRATFQRRMGPIRREIEELLEWGKADSSKAGKFKDILKHRCALWTFVRVEGVEPTNNHAEQQVRHGVLLRKVSLGTQSERGSRFIERMLTTVASLRKQGRNVHDFLVEACKARTENRAAPSLLPDHAIDKAA